MSESVVYYPASNEEGYIWEVVTQADLPFFLDKGWKQSPAEFPKEILPDRPLIEELSGPIKKKMGRPKKIL